MLNIINGGTRWRLCTDRRLEEANFAAGAKPVRARQPTSLAISSCDACPSPHPGPHSNLTLPASSSILAYLPSTRPNFWTSIRPRTDLAYGLPISALVSPSLSRCFASDCLIPPRPTSCRHLPICQHSTQSTFVIKSIPLVGEVKDPEPLKLFICRFCG